MLCQNCSSVVATTARVSSRAAGIRNTNGPLEVLALPLAAPAPEQVVLRPDGHAIGITPPLPAGPEGVERSELFSRGDAATLEAIVALVDQGVLHVHVGGRYPLVDAQRAQDQLAAHHGRGRVLLVP